MNWIEAIERKRTLLIHGTLVICIASLAVSARRNVFSFDSFWQVQTGLDWLQEGLSPWIDHFSFTFNGAPINNPPFMFQGILAILEQQFGLEPGFQLLKFFSFVLTLTLIFFFLRRLRSSVALYLVTLPLVVFLLQLRAITRPANRKNKPRLCSIRQVCFAEYG